MQVLILVMVDLQKHTASLCLNHKLVMLISWWTVTGLTVGVTDAR